MTDTGAIEQLNNHRDWLMDENERLRAQLEMVERQRDLAELGRDRAEAELKRTLRSERDNHAG